MQIYLFEYHNYYIGNNEYKVLANNYEEAKSFLLEDEDIRKYIEDEDTELRKTYSWDFVEEPQIL